MCHGIITIDTNFVRPYLDASHLIIENGKAAFVDTGTNHSVSYLLDSLTPNNLDASDVEYVFITHVHLDHAGGAGKLMKLLPNAKLVIHPRGAKHLEDPSKLVTSSKSVYGEQVFFVLYGDILYEIVTLSEPKQLFGQIDHKLEISAKCIRAREGLFDAS